MLSSWFTKLRDVKAGFKLQAKQHGSPPATSKQQHKAPTSLFKSFSLRRASNKARIARFESDILDAYRSEDDWRPSFSSSEADLCEGMLAFGLHNETTGAISTQQGTIQLHGCEPIGSSPSDVDAKIVELWDSDMQSAADCKVDIMTKMSPGIESLSATKKLGLIVSDNETEESALTSDTSSSFGSDASSADSSVSSKCSSCEEEGCQGGRIWQEGFWNSDCTCRSVQKDCEGLHEVKVSKEQKESSGCANVIFRPSQESTEIQRSLSYESQGERQVSFLFSSMGSDGGRNSSSLSSNAKNRSSTSIKSTERCTSMPILIERKANDSRSRLEGDVECGLLHDNALEHQAVDQKMPFKANGTRKINVSSQCCLQDERENAYAMIKRPETMTDKVLGTHQMSFCDIPCGKCRTFQLRQRRQRGSSISAALPPDLQGVVGDSLAFVKISNDPYEDFRQSMYEMIMEKDLEGSVDVEELLYCYLTLNSPEHHELIEEAFSDVWSAMLMIMR